MRELHHLCIQTDSYKESLDFYCRIFDFEVVKETQNFHKRAYNTWLKYGTLMIELQTGKEGESLRDYSGINKGLVHFSFSVDDVEKEYERIKALGYDNFKLKNGKHVYVVEGGKLLKVISPEGTIIEIRDRQEI
ncbi:VOC family protein [Acidaminobacter sp. JC074]|uniref:VOC family protein n=1 Tax=Acidaminobacter sp. JC074 TaxID=2530199 RepID=UPI001F10738B|nr:VOC family protein [Acidaminobacter sp. JC074]MCH4886073.1 VOC family protein [Acidaminobacter sp. JC074]